MSSSSKAILQSPPAKRVVFFHYMERKIATLPPRSLVEAENTARQLFRIPEGQGFHLKVSIQGELSEMDPRLFPVIESTLDRYWVYPNGSDPGYQTNMMQHQEIFDGQTPLTRNTAL